MKYIMRNADTARETINVAWQECRRLLRAGLAVRLEVKELKPSRSLDQNALMWSALTDIARQVKWPVDGQMQSLEPEEWKEILTAGLKKHQRVAQGIEGGFVMLGSRTSRMTIGEMAELIELCHAFGAQHEVRWSPTSIGRAAA